MVNTTFRRFQPGMLNIPSGPALPASPKAHFSNPSSGFTANSSGPGNQAQGGSPLAGLAKQAGGQVMTQGLKEGASKLIPESVKSAWNENVVDPIKQEWGNQVEPVKQWWGDITGSNTTAVDGAPVHVNGGSVSRPSSVTMEELPPPSTGEAAPSAANVAPSQIGTGEAPIQGTTGDYAITTADNTMAIAPAETLGEGGGGAELLVAESGGGGAEIGSLLGEGMGGFDMATAFGSEMPALTELGAGAGEIGAGWGAGIETGAMAGEAATTGAAAAEGAAAASSAATAAEVGTAAASSGTPWGLIIAAAAMADSATGGHIMAAPMQSLSNLTSGQPFAELGDSNWWGNISGYNSLFGSGGLFS